MGQGCRIRGSESFISHDRSADKRRGRRQTNIAMQLTGMRPRCERSAPILIGSVGPGGGHSQCGYERNPYDSNQTAGNG